VDFDQLQAIASEPYQDNIFVLENKKLYEKNMVDILLYHAGCDVPKPTEIWNTNVQKINKEYLSEL